MKPSPWIQIKETLINTFTSVAVDQIKSAGGVHLPFETPEWAAEWKGRRTTFIHPLQGHSLYLNISNVYSRGWDDIDYLEQDTGLVKNEAPTGIFEVFETVSGIRQFTLTAESWCLEESDEASSFNIIERLRTFMDYNSSHQMLLDGNIALIESGTSRDMRRTLNKKKYSITALPFTFAACIQETDTNITGYIARVIITSHEQAGGVDVKSSLRMIEEELPPE